MLTWVLLLKGAITSSPGEWRGVDSKEGQEMKAGGKTQWQGTNSNHKSRKLVLVLEDSTDVDSYFLPETPCVSECIWYNFIILRSWYLKRWLNRGYCVPKSGRRLLTVYLSFANWSNQLLQKLGYIPCAVHINWIIVIFLRTASSVPIPSKNCLCEKTFFIPTLSDSSSHKFFGEGID